MSSTLTPFLYQTRTLQRVLRRSTFTTRIGSRSYAYQKRQPRSDEDTAIPFDWTNIKPPEENRSPARNGQSDIQGKDDTGSTITPSEAHIFKGIFDEIAQGKMPKAKKSKRRLPPAERAPVKEESELNLSLPESNPRSIVEQARMTDFREKVLSRFPESLREAAQLALGLFELETGAEVIDTETQEQRAERIKFEQVRAEEKARVDALMRACETDIALWKVMEMEVFSLPERLGIASQQKKEEQPPRGKKKSAKASPTAEEPATDESAATKETGHSQKRIMDVHGPLYSHYLSQGLTLFDTMFAKPSSFAFQILPRVRALGLPSYVLGVSTTFYTSLAAMHWDRFGDAVSALDVLQEMMATGLTADDEVRTLLVRIRDHVLGCTWGAQGPFVSGMMEAPPYDGALMQRIEELDEFAELTLKQTGDYST